MYRENLILIHLLRFEWKFEHFFYSYCSLRIDNKFCNYTLIFIERNNGGLQKWTKYYIIQRLHSLSWRYKCDCRVILQQGIIFLVRKRALHISCETYRKYVWMGVVNSSNRGKYIIRRRSSRMKLCRKFTVASFSVLESTQWQSKVIALFFGEIPAITFIFVIYMIYIKHFKHIFLEIWSL